jgi:hypothetical protein
MSVITERHLRTHDATRDATQVLADRRAAGTLPSAVHVLLDLAVADDAAQLRATLGALADLADAAGIPVHLGTAGGPASLGRLHRESLEPVARHLEAFARGADAEPVFSRAILRTGPRHPRLAHLLGARPVAVLVAARPPADRAATTRSLAASAGNGLPWLVLTGAPDLGSLVAALLDAWDHHTVPHLA